MLPRISLGAGVEIEEIRASGAMIPKWLEDLKTDARDGLTKLIKTLKGDKYKQGILENHFNNFRTTTRKIHFLGIGLGVALAVGGGAGIASFYTLNLASTSAAKLIGNIAEIEEQIYKLHQKKLQALFEYKTRINREAVYKPESDHWIYEL